jgi:hypothetical protein
MGEVERSTKGRSIIFETGLVSKYAYKVRTDMTMIADKNNNITLKILYQNNNKKIGYLIIV